MARQILIYWSLRWLYPGEAQVVARGDTDMHSPGPASHGSTISVVVELCEYMVVARYDTVVDSPGRHGMIYCFLRKVNPRVTLVEARTNTDVNCSGPANGLCMPA